MLPALISAIEAIWRSVVAEKPCRPNSFAAASSIASRDFSDFVVDIDGGALCLRLRRSARKLCFNAREGALERTASGLTRRRLAEANDGRCVIFIFRPTPVRIIGAGRSPSQSSKSRFRYGICAPG